MLNNGFYVAIIIVKNKKRRTIMGGIILGILVFVFGFLEALIKHNS